MKCLNTKNREVASLLDEYSEIFGKNAAYFVLSENNGYGLDKASNGEPSRLYSDLLTYYNGDRLKAIVAKSKIYLQSFKDKFGNWLSSDSNIPFVDENGEPTIQSVVDNQNQTTTDAVRYNSNIVSNNELRTKNTQVSERRNQKLASLLQKLYPKIKIEALTDPNLRGQARVEGHMAGIVLLNSLLENSDTLPHEYAHHYIAWFRNHPLVQRGIKLFGSEEALVQAIGENSVAALKWYNRLWNAIKALFNSKQRVLNMLTKEFLSGNELAMTDQTINDVFTVETHNQVVDNTNPSIMPFERMYNKIKTAIDRRIKDIEHSKFKGNRDNSIRSIAYQLDQLDNIKAITEFIEYGFNDIRNQESELRQLQLRYADSKKNNTDHGITSEQLDIIRKGFIGFYNNIIDEISNLLESPQAFEFLEEEYREELLNLMQHSKNSFETSKRIFNQLNDNIAKDNITKLAESLNDYTKQQIQDALNDGSSDINWFDRYMGLPSYINNPLVQLLFKKMVDTKYHVYELKLAKSKRFLRLLNKLKDKSKLDLLFEKDVKGNKTGYLVSDINYGSHQQNYEAFLTKLAAEFGYPDAENPAMDVPSKLNREQYREWVRRLNEWDAENSERKFLPEYYKITNILSREARERRDDINARISLILTPVTDANGVAHKEDLSPSEYQEYLIARRQRSNLSNMYYEDGTEKLGVDKEIALEFQEYNNRLKNNLDYKPNKEKFNKAFKEAKENLSPEKFKLWLERNTEIVISPEFYDLVNKILSKSRTMSEDEKILREQRNHLLRLYRKSNGDTDVIAMPDSVKKQIKILDDEIAKLRGKIDKAANAALMDIAHYETNPQFQIEFDNAKALGEYEFNEWLKVNTVKIGKDKYRPASFWQRLVPNKEYAKLYVSRVPNRDWMEIDTNSPLYNKNYKPMFGETRVPKADKYRNKVFEKVKNDLELYEIWKELYNTNQEVCSSIHYMRYSNPLRLAQIDGGTYNRLTRNDTVLKGLTESAKLGFSVHDQDTEYGSTAVRSDGSPVKLVPTHFIERLKNPNTISDDILGITLAYYGMAMNFKEMSKLAPEMETVLDYISRSEVKKGKGVTVSGIQSNMYAKLNALLDDFAYGKQISPLNVSMFGKKISLAKVLTKLASWTRLIGISQNLNVILTGLITNAVIMKYEAISGINFNSANLRNASAIMTSEMANILSNIGNPDNKCKMLCYLELLGVVRDIDRDMTDLEKNRILRVLKKHYWYAGHEISDLVTKGRAMIAIGLHYKFIPEENKVMSENEFYRWCKKQGKTKNTAKALWKANNDSFFDLFEVKDNELVLKDKFKGRVSENDINRIRNISRQTGTKIDTQFSELDKNFATANIFGKLIFIYRNYLLVWLQTKFATKSQFNLFSGLYEDSQMHAAYIALRTYFSKQRMAQLEELWKENFDEVNDFNKAMLRRTVAEILISCVLFNFLYHCVFKAAADDDDTFLNNEYALLSLRAGIELRNNLLPIETINLFKSPTVAWETVRSLLNFGVALFDEPNKKITRGAYKGLRKWQRSLIKLTPLKLYYDTLNPKEKRQYLENMKTV